MTKITLTVHLNGQDRSRDIYLDDLEDETEVQAVLGYHAQDLVSMKGYNEEFYTSHGRTENYPDALKVSDNQPI